MSLFCPNITDPGSVNATLRANHYLGPTSRGFAWVDEHGVAVFARPTSRMLPGDGTWLELTRWCLNGQRNAGSKQWAKAWRAIAADRPSVTTFVSYSDPSVGHTGALYKACNWIWAPTWHRLRPPPTGNGSWSDAKTESVKDRWVFPIRPDDRRIEILSVKDQSLTSAGCAQYREPRRLPKMPDYDGDDCEQCVKGIR